MSWPDEKDLPVPDPDTWLADSTSPEAPQGLFEILVMLASSVSSGILACIGLGSGIRLMLRRRLDKRWTNRIETFSQLMLLVLPLAGSTCM